MSKKPTILVCGGAGFMGSDFVRYILSKSSTGHIIVYDKLTYAGNLDNLAPIKDDKRYTFIKGDIANEKGVRNIFDKYKPDYVINFAAETHVDRSIHGGTDVFIYSNISGVKTLLDIIRQSPFTRRFVQISTDEVYGDTPLNSKFKFKEDFPLRPSNPYSVTKASSDMMCLAYNRTYNTPVIITRSGNTFGPYQYPEKLIPQSIFKGMNNKSIPLYSKGQHIRDWVYVRDHSKGVETVLFKGHLGQVYNISGGKTWTNIDTVRAILKNVGASIKLIKYVADRPGHDMRYALDSKKLRKLGWKPDYDFQYGLIETIKWYKANPNWVKKFKKN